MRRCRGVLSSLIALGMVLGGPRGVRPAAAQLYESTLQSLDYAPDPTARSPRLLGMGRLTLLDDVHNHISLWDFAGNPTGIAEAETASVVEYRPGTRSSEAIRDQWPSTREQEVLRARQLRHGVETWRRGEGGTAYGLVGEVATLERSRPFSPVLEEREKFSVPTLNAAVNGHLPWIHGNRVDYAVRAGYSHESYDDQFFDFLELPQGSYLGRPSSAVDARDAFTPDHQTVSSLGFGGAFALRVSSGLKAALGLDRVTKTVVATNEGLRSSSRTDEKRPFNIAQGSLIARLGHQVEFGADARAWRSQSEEMFRWSVSAGQGNLALAGRGKRLSRREEGTSLRTRARWSAGPLELNASAGSSFRRLVITPWYPVNEGDPAGFNDFLDQAGFRPGADTLLLPARVQNRRVKENAYDLVAGAAWRLPHGRGVVAGEAHRSRRATDTRLIGAGPNPVQWDFRAGAEVRCSSTFLARAGGGYGLSDQDALTADDTYRHASATAGFGYLAPGSRWSLDLAYSVEWLDPDFADPTRSRETRRQLAVQSRWPF